jgi:hypothetical protein
VALCALSQGLRWFPLPRGVDAAQGATCGVLLRSPLGTGVTAHSSYPASQARWHTPRYHYARTADA